MRVFKLPDLGEGLQEAEVCEWHVDAGDRVQSGDTLVSVETDKAIVEIPAPWSGVIEKRFAEAEAIVQVGAPLAGFSGDEPARDGTAPASTAHEENGSVVGEVKTGRGLLREDADSVAAAPVGIKATPAVRALARRLDVDLTVVTPSGNDGLITKSDVERVARILEEAGPLEPLRGPRRAMARSMTQAHAEVAGVSITDDADLGAWRPGQDITLRLIRAIVAGCKAEPALNAWYDSHSMGRRLLQAVHLGVAVDTPDGLFVPGLRDVGQRDAKDLAQALARIKADVRSRSIPPEEMRGHTITLSNFGSIGGRYSQPIVVPPTVAILGAGRLRDQVIAVDGQPAVRPILPLSLSFDHRAVTGAEATRFLQAAIIELQAAD